MRANIFLRATGMRDRDKRPDQLPFLIGKFITTGFHACHFFLPLSYHGPVKIYAQNCLQAPAE